MWFEEGAEKRGGRAVEEARALKLTWPTASSPCFGFPFISVTILEAVLTFLIDSYRSMYLCALELVVFGSLAIVIGAVEEARPTLLSVLPSLFTSLFAR